MKVKSILMLCILVLQATFCLAQGNKQKIPPFKSEQFVQNVRYFSDNVIKATKVKDATLKTEIVQLINRYNLNLEELLLLNKDLMDLAEINVNEKFKILQLNPKDNTVRESIHNSIDSLKPLKEKVDAMSLELDKKFESLLSKKLYKKWLKYKKRELQKIMPEGPETNNANQQQRAQSPFNNRNRNRNQRRGF